MSQPKTGELSSIVSILFVVICQELSTYTGYTVVESADPNTSGHSRKIFALKFHPLDKDTFVSAGWDDTLRVSINIFIG